jgi:hypothetical protein
MDFGFTFSSNFWSTVNTAKPSQRFSELLQKPELSIEELLQDSETVTEIQNSNSKLLDFLTADKLYEILCYVVVEPEVDADYDRGYRLPYLAQKVLTV